VVQSASVHCSGEAERRGQALALGAGTTTAASARRSQVEEGGVAANAGDDGGARELVAEQGGVGAVGDQPEAMVGQPLDELEDHPGRQLDQAELLFFFFLHLLPLAVQADHHRQGQRLATPGRGDAKGEDHHVEAPGRHLVGDRSGGDRVVEVAGAVHLAPALVDQGVVEQQGEPALRCPMLDEVDDQARQSSSGDHLLSRTQRA
jgi:hypothetical protein